MVKHVIIWTLKEGYSAEEAAKIKKGIKDGLEGLIGKVPGLKEAHVYTEPLPSSNADVILESVCEDEKALGVYANHPEHVAVKDNKIVPFVSSRVCMDYKI